MLRTISLFAVCAITIVQLSGTTQAAEKDEWSIGKHLKVAGQPAKLADLKDAGESYRLVVIDAGLTSSTIVLIYLKGTDPMLKAASVDLHGYYNSDGKEGVESKERKLTREEWQAFKQKFTAADFWKLQTPNQLTLDGVEWIFEAKAFGKNRQVKINSPDPGNYRALCLESWRLSGLFMGNFADLKE